MSKRPRRICAEIKMMSSCHGRRAANLSCRSAELPATNVVAAARNKSGLEGLRRTADLFLTPRHHVDLAEQLNLNLLKTRSPATALDLPGRAAVGWALLNCFIEAHLAEGYEMMLVPHILELFVRLYGGQFPKFQDGVYWLIRTKRRIIPAGGLFYRRRNRWSICTRMKY